jgi:hypothetical protein
MFHEGAQLRRPGSAGFLEKDTYSQLGFRSWSVSSDDCKRPFRSKTTGERPGRRLLLSFKISVLVSSLDLNRPFVRWEIPASTQARRRCHFKDSRGRSFSVTSARGLVRFISEVASCQVFKSCCGLREVDSVLRTPYSSLAPLP